jgi:hypothetical protein
MLHLSIGMFIADSSILMPDGPNGPLFNRWLPDGEKDALVFPSESPDKSLRVWFVRRGRMDGGFVRYDSNKHEVDESVMSRQGWLDAGPLRGEAKFALVSAAEMEAIRSDRRGSTEYLTIGKRIVDFLFTPLQGLLDTLRLQYGQYWLTALSPWDSRIASLGGYCQGTFHLKWRESVQDEWRPFLPDEPRQSVHALPVPGRGYTEFLTKEDWKTIGDTLIFRSTHPLALRIAGRAHELKNNGFVAESYIQAVTALELALEHYLVSRSTAFGKASEGALGAFTSQPLTQQLLVLAIATGVVDAEAAQAGTRVIEARNKIVHEAKDPPSLSEPDLLGVLKCIQNLLGLGELKLPRLTNVNQIAAPEAGVG